MVEVTRVVLEVPLFGLVTCFITYLPADPAPDEGPAGPTSPAGAVPAPAPSGGAPVAPPPHAPAAPPDGPASPPERKRGPVSLAASPEEARGLMAFRPLVRGVLRRCRVPDRDVPDVAQNILLQLLPWWKGRCQLAAAPDAPADTGRAYVHVAAVHSAGRYHRKDARRGERLGWEPERAEEGDDPDDAAPPESPSPEELWLELEDAAERLTATDLDRLGHTTKPACWRAFYAHAIVGATVAQIAEAEGVAISSIYARIRLARRDIRAALLRSRAANRTH